ncbi:MAG: hypothetical protein RMK00_05790 [Bacteroidota bacterium]|nr:hypothetical protein [Candidatus Kapabacteria bacterium]MDW8075267.1 hypothetical protein [Bacteroidota bacterium]
MCFFCVEAVEERRDTPAEDARFDTLFADAVAGVRVAFFAVLVEEDLRVAIETPTMWESYFRF